jgi:hypothetical protein
MNWEKIDVLCLSARRALLNHLHNSRADSPITTQKTTVFTVEFTKKLLKKPGSGGLPERPEAPTLRLDALQPISIGKIPKTLFYLFPGKKARHLPQT